MTCNELEVWLMEQGYSDKLVKQQVLKAHKYKRKDLNDMEDKRDFYKLVFSITYHLNFFNLKDIMSFLHLSLTPDKEKKDKVPITGSQRAKIMKDILVRAKDPPVKKNEGFFRCEMCEHIASTDSFKSTMTQNGPTLLDWKT